MRKVALLSLIATLLPLSLYAASAYAEQALAWVDPNTGSGFACTQTQPCADVNTALNTLANGGTVVITTGVVPPFTIGFVGDRVITCQHPPCIVNNSDFFGVASGTPAVKVSAPGLNVSLQGLTLTPLVSAAQSTGTAGLLVTDVGRLELKNVSILAEPIGINFTPGSGAANSHLFIENSDIRNSGTRNVLIAPTSSNSVSAVVTNSRIHDGNAGIVVDASTGTGGVSVVVDRSEISFMNSNNVNVIGNAFGAAARVMLDRVVLSHSSGNCIASGNATATVAMTKTRVTQCQTALFNNGGSIFTSGDNDISFNTSNGATPTTTVGFR